ncbi:MAG: HDIG domain-containing protein [Deltaproteobacteria bacterium]|nr:HDIG domain-containing protein [Deltaproteobacteria bacterium]
MNDKEKLRPLNRGDGAAARPGVKADRKAGNGPRPSSGKGERDAARKKPAAPLPWLTHERLLWGCLVLLSTLFAVLLFPNILTQGPDYQIGDVAETGIKASHDFLIENREQTERNRGEAAKQALAVYDFDRTLSDLLSRVREAFAFARRPYEEVFPPESQELPGPEAGIEAQSGPEETAPIRDRFFGILDLTPDETLFERLRENRFSTGVEQAVVPLLGRILGKGIVANGDRLLSQAEKGGIILHDLYTRQETRVENLDRFYDMGSAAAYVEGQADDIAKQLGNPAAAAVAVELATALLQPNVTFNQRETELRKEAARSGVKPTYFKIKKGEMLVREGERIGPEHLEKLAGEFRSRDRLDMLGRIPAMTVLIGLFFTVMYLVGFRGLKVLREDRRDLVFNAVTLIGLFVFAWAYRFVADEVARGFTFMSPRSLIYAMPVACAGMLLSIFQGLAVATSFSLIIAVLASLVCGGQVALFVYFFLGSLVAAYGVRRCTERGTLIKAGLKVSLINVLLALCIEMIYGTLYSFEALIAVSAGFAGGILAAIIATGFLPLIEMSFGFTTDIKLLELASLDQPLLRKLLVQAPGTYHHSVIISNLVEATAQAVNANPLLAKVCAYYHDIGKMKKPLYFIENQQGGENKHEKLAPSMSGLVLTAHVKDGVELARKHGLGSEIIDTIQQHHGTSLITYFYQKARERAETRAGKYSHVKEEDFRYPGPKPQTKEAGLVMLADMVEAASRSLSEPTPSRIQGTVHKMINKAFSDGQLDECELTLKDLHEIAKNFNKTLAGIFHQRIKYPEAGESRPEKKGRNGYPDQRPEEDTGARKADDTPRNDKSLRRLGLS